MGDSSLPVIANSSLSQAEVLSPPDSKCLKRAEEEALAAMLLALMRGLNYEIPLRMDIGCPRWSDSTLVPLQPHALARIRRLVSLIAQARLKLA
jgi:hypothetical protein